VKHRGCLKLKTKSTITKKTKDYWKEINDKGEAGRLGVRRGTGGG
jgi:hypothetical protein